jgi:hypothetical protein
VRADRRRRVPPQLRVRSEGRPVSVWGALAGGVVGTIVLTTGLRAAQELGLTRMDIPLLLGTAFSANRSRASVIGYALHFVNGVLFSLGYAGIFLAVDEAGWLFGLALGAAHAAVAGGGLVNLALPAIHPRMATPWTDAEETPLLEPPGFMLMNYGHATAAVTVALHLAYGAIVGGFAAGL